MPLKSKYVFTQQNERKTKFFLSTFKSIIVNVSKYGPLGEKWWFFILQEPFDNNTDRRCSLDCVCCMMRHYICTKSILHVNAHAYHSFTCSNENWKVQFWCTSMWIFQVAIQNKNDQFINCSWGAELEAVFSRRIWMWRFVLHCCRGCLRRIWQ